MKSLIVKTVRSFGYDIIKHNKNPYPDLDSSFYTLYNLYKNETMTSIERMHALYEAAKYIHNNKIDGDVVECGVWRGGSSMMIASCLLNNKEEHRYLYLYDTYEGMSEPTEADVSIKNENVFKNWNKYKNTDTKIFAYASLEIVKKNMQSTNYPQNKVNFIKGKVEDTIPDTVPKKISLLRLDTDWYESTKHELIHLWDRVSLGGIIIIDDYGHWAGSRKAVDEFLAERNIYPYLHRIDYTGRLIIKT